MKENFYVQFIPSLGHNPQYWVEWKESDYFEIFKFYRDIINTIDSSSSEYSLNAMYGFQIGLETAQIFEGVSLTFAKRIWEDFSKQFDPNHSTGIMVNATPKNVSQLISIYRDTGSFPKEYGLRITSSNDQDLNALLKTTSETDRPIVATIDCNDVAAIENILRFREDFGTNVLGVLQMPHDPTTGLPTSTYCSSNYGMSKLVTSKLKVTNPVLSEASLSCGISCLEIKGENLTRDLQLEIFLPNTSNPIARLGSDVLTFSDDGHSIKFKLPDHIAKLYDEVGIELFAYNAKLRLRSKSGLIVNRQTASPPLTFKKEPEVLPIGGLNSGAASITSEQSEPEQNPETLSDINARSPSQDETPSPSGSLGP